MIDQIQTVTIAGHDLAEDDKVRTTVVAPFFAKEGELQDLYYTNTASTIYKNKIKLNAQASEQLLNAKMEVILYSKELAEKGMEDYIRYLLRDPSIGANLHLAVTEGSSKDILKSFETGKGTGMYLEDLLEHNVQHGHLPLADLKEFSSHLESKSRDPFLPMLGLKDGKPYLKALALFDEDKLVDTIPIQETGVFKMLYERVSDGQYNVSSSDFEVSIQNIESSRSIKAVKKDGQVEVTINVQMKGVIREFSKDKAVSRLPAN